jgi:hypothetical protein
MKTSTGGKILVALAFASVIGGLSVGTALGDDNGRRHAQQNRDRYERDRHERDWPERDRRDNRGWRDNRGHWHAHRPFYAPPPVVHVPAPSPGISIFFPLFR